MLISEKKDFKSVALKLHKQFSHPSSERLKNLVKDSGLEEKEKICKEIDNVTENCDICKRFKRTPPRPIVGFPLASIFNQTVAMDLKFVEDRILLHLLDHATRYSQACIITNKRKETIVKALLNHWVGIFGSPEKFLFDNGGEFINDELKEFAEQFNITIMTTAAESPWSNGLCEKHNGILEDLIIKTRNDSNCSIETALSWSLAAKNNLMNI